MYAVQDLKREIETLKRAGCHPNVVQLHGYCIHNSMYDCQIPIKTKSINTCTTTHITESISVRIIKSSTKRHKLLSLSTFYIRLWKQIIYMAIQKHDLKFP